MGKAEFDKLPKHIKICVAIRKWNLSGVLANGRIELPKGEALQLHNGYVPMRNKHSIQLFLN